MKRWIVLSLLFVPFLAAAAGFWDGNAALQRGDATFESGLYATSNSFPPGTQITIQNQDTGKTVTATITGRIEGQSDILVLLSPKTAEALDLPQGTLGRVRVTVPPKAASTASGQPGDQTTSSDPDVNPAAAYGGNESPVAAAPTAVPATGTPATRHRRPRLLHRGDTSRHGTRHGYPRGSADSRSRGTGTGTASDRPPDNDCLDDTGTDRCGHHCRGTGPNAAKAGLPAAPRRTRSSSIIPSRRRPRQRQPRHRPRAPQRSRRWKAVLASRPRRSPRPTWRSQTSWRPRSRGLKRSSSAGTAVPAAAAPADIAMASPDVIPESQAPQALTQAPRQTEVAGPRPVAPPGKTPPKLASCPRKPRSPHRRASRQRRRPRPRRRRPRPRSRRSRRRFRRRAPCPGPARRLTSCSSARTEMRSLPESLPQSSPPRIPRSY